MEMAKVFTVEETAEILKTSAKTILDEIEVGRLEAFMVGGEWRTTDKSVTDFISRGGSQPAGNASARQTLSNLKLQQVAAFQYTWPGGETEEYSEAYEGTLNEADTHYEVIIGIGERKAAGKNRKRVTVFLNGRPTVEFAGVDDFESSRLVAGVVTLPDKKRLKPHQTVPYEYRSFNLRRYDSVVKGPRAATTMAVVAKIDDFDTMVSHAVIRAMYRDQM